MIRPTPTRCPAALRPDARRSPAGVVGAVRGLPLGAALGVALVLGGCREQKSERELLIEATTLAQRGDFDASLAILDRLYAANPTSADVLIRYTGFLVDAGDLERADEFLGRLDRMDLRGTERGRADMERRRYFEAIFERAAGDGPAAPADKDAYERAMIGLINLERTGTILDDYNTYLIMQARASLGGAPERPIDPSTRGNVAAVASPTQARAALVYLDRVLDGDPRCQVRRELEGAPLLEAQAVRQALRAKIFSDDFDRAWEVRFRDAFEQAERFDPATRRFRVHYDGPYREGYSAESGEERLTYQAQTWHARELATDLAYELAGLPRLGAPPLDYAVEDFATTQVSGLTPGETTLAFDLALPYETARRGAFLLHELRSAPHDSEPPVTE
ncbi:MAG: tetratricopeptide repeat protein [Myxococcales bacterium]|nr:tetratricopeptide repeat protein [Myxococcales bacterium]MCB9531000.1 tetratricopeptide repeat protein [Myxococcales bacterium]MCB9532920.1 tetratricopeptide repeat protein [Myxococcales bacterium]